MRRLRRHIPLLICLALLMGSATAHAKRQRVLHTEAEMAQMRQNVQAHAWARAEVAAAVARAERWVKLTDEELWQFFPTAAVSRAVHVNPVQGCPVHGVKIFEGRGFYPWRRSPDKPFKVQCPVGEEWYPSNDYAAQYAASGGKGIKGQLDTRQQFNDDGCGYVDKEGHRYCFVAYDNQWAWHERRDAARDLGRAYLLTGEPQYAHKATVALARLAAIYPEMDYATQSDGGTAGRILYGQWETGNVNVMAPPYDDIYPYLAAGGDPTLTAFLRDKGITDVRIHIEKNLLQEFAKSLQTNTQMVPGVQGSNDLAMALVAVIWDDDDPARGMTTQQMLDWAWRGVGWNVEALVHNDTYRDGFECEEGLGYNFAMRDQLVETARLFQRAGRDLWREPKLRKLLDAPLEVVMLDRFTPSMGDSGGLPFSGKLGWSGNLYAQAYRVYRDPRYAAVAALGNARGADALFQQDPEADIRRAASEPAASLHQPTRNFGGFGLGVLERGEGDNGRALTLWYGSSGGGHSHRDRLNLELFALGTSLAPDLGYPEHWGSPRNVQWVSNTASHNTVLVDAQGQPNAGWNDPGSGYLTLFARSQALDVIEAEGAPAYGGATSVYRRLVALVDLSATAGYALDVFRVRGGTQHDYLFHSNHGTFRLAGAELTPPDPRGTVAGPDVAPEAQYEQKMSGLQFLYNPQRAIPGGQWCAEWALRDQARLRLTMLPGCAQEVFVADGDPSWRRGGPLKYVVARNRGTDLATTYAAVLEPYRDRPLLQSVTRLEAQPPDPAFVALRVTGQGATHTLLCAPSEALATQRQVAGGTRFAGQWGFISERDGKPDRMLLVNGTELAQERVAIRAAGPVRGHVTGVDYATNTVLVDCDLPGPGLVGQTVVFGNEKRHSNYEVKGVSRRPDGWALLLGDTITELCRCTIAALDPVKRTVKTDTPILLYTNGLEFPGMRLVNEARTAACRIEGFDAIGKTGVNWPPFGGVATVSGDVDLKAAFTDADGDGRTLCRVYEFGAGDSFEVANACSVERRNPWVYRAASSGSMTLTVAPEGTGDGVWVKVAGQQWMAAKAQATQHPTPVAVTYDPATMGAGPALVVVNKPAWLDLSDAEPPRVERIVVDGKELADAPTIDLGRIASFDEVSWEVADRLSPIDPDAIRVSVDGRELSLRDPALSYESLAPDRRRGRLTCRPRLTGSDAAPGRQTLSPHTVVLQLADLAPNTGTVTRTVRLALVSPPPEHALYLSDLRPTRAFSHGFFTDRGLNAPSIVLRGISYARGLFAHPELAAPQNHSEIIYDLARLHEYRRFLAVCGVEDSAGGGSVEFVVFTRAGQGAWQERWRSAVVRVGDTPRPVEVLLDGADELRLVVTDGGDGYGCDHAFWADAHLLRV